MKNEIDFLKEIEPYGFDDMDSNIECPNCGEKMRVSGMPDEEYMDSTFRAADVYYCPECSFNAIITSCFKLDHKEVEYYLEDMETDEEE